MSHMPAPLALAAFIAETRPDWDRLQIQQTIDRARTVGWAYEHFVGALIRTAFDKDATPAEVDHMRPKTPPRPTSWTRGEAA
jgi:hypothetical protein